MLESFTAGIYFVDFEYHPVNGVEGNPPDPICLVVLNLKTGVTSRYFREQLRSMEEAPFDTGPDSLFVAFYAPAEMDCFIQLGWSPPKNVLDLFVEFRNLTNGIYLPNGKSLLGAMAYYGLTSIAPTKKDAMRDLILSRGPWSKKQESDILDYCQSDVEALEQLFLVMQSKIDWPRALLRGHYMKAVSQIQACGIPMDVALLQETLLHWDNIREQLIGKIDTSYGVYEDQTFKRDRFEAYLMESNIPWPCLPSGSLDLSENAFRQTARGYPQIAPLHELRSTLSKLRLNGLTVGEDGRNRYMLSPFSSKTGRNQPSNVRAIYGPSAWMRGFIKPTEGMAIAYIDWGQQEFGIAGVLSGDLAMQAAYKSGDPYLAFAKQAGAIPTHATKQSHPVERDRFKACILGVQYGMGPHSLASQIGQSVDHAKVLLDLHRRTYPDFWGWSDKVQEHYALGGKLSTEFGWELQPVVDFNPRSVRNFPMQANGAEMLRLACIHLTEAGIRVCAPVHDAVLIKAPSDEIDDTIELARQLMAQASREVLDGFELNTDVEVVRYPDRYMDKRGAKMWDTVREIIRELKA
jgi:DNA polymerase I